MSPREFGQWCRRIARQFKGEVDKGLFIGLQRGLPVLWNATRGARPASPNGARGAVDKGNFLKSWHVERIGGIAMLVNFQPYASIIEAGRRAGARMPPVSVIRDWLMSRHGLSFAEAKRAAFPVARAIAERGLAPREVYKGAIPEIQRIAMRTIGERLDRLFAQGRAA